MFRSKVALCVAAVGVTIFASIFTLVGCGGQVGGFPSGLGGSLVDGKIHPATIPFGASVNPGRTSPTIEVPPAARYAFVTIQGVGYLGSAVTFKPILLVGNTNYIPNLTLPGNWPLKVPDKNESRLVPWDTSIGPNPGEFTKEGTDPKLFNLGDPTQPHQPYKKRVFIEWFTDCRTPAGGPYTDFDKAHQGNSLGVSTFEIDSSAALPAKSTLQLNPVGDVTFGNGTLSHFTINVESVPRLLGGTTPAILKSVNVAVTDTFDAQTFDNTVDITGPSNYRSGSDTDLAPIDVTFIDKGNPFTFKATLYASVQGTGAVIGRETGAATSAVDGYHLPMGPDVATHFEANPSQVTLKPSQLVTLVASLVDENGASSPITAPAVAFATQSSDNVGHPFANYVQNLGGGVFRGIANNPSGVTLSVSMSTTTETTAPPGGYNFQTTTPVPFNVIEGVDGLTVLNATRFESGEAVFELPRTSDITTGATQIQLAAVDRFGNRVALPTNYNVDPFYTGRAVTHSFVGPRPAFLMPDLAGASPPQSGDALLNFKSKPTSANSEVELTITYTSPETPLAGRSVTVKLRSVVSQPLMQALTVLPAGQIPLPIDSDNNAAKVTLALSLQTSAATVIPVPNDYNNPADPFYFGSYPATPPYGNFGALRVISLQWQTAGNVRPAFLTADSGFENNLVFKAKYGTAVDGQTATLRIFYASPIDAAVTLQRDVNFKVTAGSGSGGIH
jgi:hypothetical protein